MRSTKYSNYIRVDLFGCFHKFKTVKAIFSACCDPNYIRLEILYLNLKDKPLSPDISLEELAQMLEGYSGADIRRICEKACDIPFVESVETGEERDLEKRDLLSVMQQVRPSVSAKSLDKFQRFAAGGS